MLDYAQQRAREVLGPTHTAVLATSGPAGVQASEVPCEAIALALYLLVPRTSDHLFNLEQVPEVSLLAEGWELKGKAQIISPAAVKVHLDLLRKPEAEWCVLVRVSPYQVHIRKTEGWGFLESIDLKISE